MQVGCVSHAPNEQIVRLPQAHLDYIARKADERSEYRAYAKRGDAWGVGVRTDAVFVGMCGEYAARSFINLRAPANLPTLDTALLRRGDGGVDIKISGLTIQVKTRNTGRRNLIRRERGGSILALRSTVYLFAEWRPKESLVSLLGWSWAGDLRDRGIFECGVRRDEWFNLRIDDVDLLSMARLISEIQARRK